MNETVLIDGADIGTNVPAREKTPFEIGEEFEKYVESLFNIKSRRFEIFNYKSDNAYLYGERAARCTYPDLKFLFHTRTNSYKFAIECKWIEFCAGRIIWAQQYQLNNYLKYQEINQIPIFIAIGIGGEASLPEKLYVTPLSHINNRREVYEEELIPYKRKLTRNFFYDAKQIKLF